MKHIGIFGGTFNPPHIAHAIAAQEVCEQLHLDKLLIMPSAVPLLKKSPSTTAEQRLKMCRLAFGDNDTFEVSEIEINRNESSYTIDTLIELNKFYKKSLVKLFLIIGIDNLIQLEKWKNPDKLFSLAEVAVVNRPGITIKDFNSKYVTMVKYLKIPSMDVSSSYIRYRVKMGLSIKYFVHPNVEKYIYNHNLYI